MQTQKKPRTSPEFPLDVQRGSVTVRIYRIKNRGRVLFTVSHRGPSGSRTRQNFADLEVAKTEAGKIATRILNGQTEVLKMSNSDQAIYVRAKELLSPFNRDLDVAIAEYADAMAALKGSGTLTEAARFFARHHMTVTERKRLPEIYDEFLEAKKADGAGSRYLQECTYRLKRFIDVFAGAISDCTTAEIQAWLVGLPGSPRSRNNMRRLVVTLFNFAKQRGYLPRDRQTEADPVSKAKAASSKIGILEPDQMKSLLAKAEKSLVPYLVISGFAGLRQSELMRLEWEDVKFDQGLILVDAKKSKTGQRRLVPMQENLVKWLHSFRDSSGRIYESPRTLGRITSLAKELGIEWPHNALRHSYASYRLAVCKNAAEVAHEMGNSPQMVYQHYRELVTPVSATAWWAIRPRK